MKTAAKLLLLTFALGMFAAPSFAARRDPLTKAEIDQLRDVAQDAPERIKLYVKFVKARFGLLDQLRTDPRFAADRPEQMHDLLEDVTTLVDEMDDNIDTYAGRKSDMRKALKEVIELDSDMQLKLRALKQTATTDPVAMKESKSYGFVLDNAIEAVNASLDNARKTMDEQEAMIKAEKEAEKKKK